MIQMILGIVMAAIGIWLGCIKDVPFTGAIIFSFGVIVFTHRFKARRAV